MFKRIVVSLATALIFTSHGYADFAAVVVGYVDFPPFTYLENEIAKGIFIERAKKIQDKIGLKVLRYELLPAPRLFAELQEGKPGQVQMWYGIELFPEKIAYTEKKIGEIILNVWALKDFPSSDLEKITLVEDLKNYDLVLLRGYGYGGWGAVIHEPKNGYKFTEVTDHAASIRFLETKRAQLLLNYTYPVEQMLGKEGIDRLLSAKTVQRLAVKFGVSKLGYPAHSSLIKALNDNTDGQ